MLKGIYYVCALVTYIPFLFFHGFVSLLIWDSAPWDDACGAAGEVIDNVTSSRK